MVNWQESDRRRVGGQDFLRAKTVQRFTVTVQLPIVHASIMASGLRQRQSCGSGIGLVVLNVSD